jgi:hypothetical protein
MGRIGGARQWMRREEAERRRGGSGRAAAGVKSCLTITASTQHDAWSEDMHAGAGLASDHIVATGERRMHHIDSDQAR